MTLVEARRKMGLSQRDLANIVGISPTSLSAIENYQKFPRRETQKRLRKIFGDAIEFFPAEALVGMIHRFIGSEKKLAVHRAKFLTLEIQKVLECIQLDVIKVHNHKTK